MLLFKLPAVTTEAELRLFVQETLRSWIRDLDHGSIPVRIPRLRGQMRLIRDKPFHLWPELFLQLSGKTTFEFPEERFSVGPGEICLVPRGMPHHERVRAWKGPFHNIVFMCGPREVDFHLAREKPHGMPLVALGCRMQAGPSVASVLEQAAELAQTNGEARESGIKGLVLAHLSLLLATMEGWTAAANPEPFKVSHTRQLVMQLLSKPDLSVGMLARQLQCSADYLSQLFRKSTGTPLLAYINEHRLLRACELLHYSTLNVAEVSEAAGFRDPSYFTRVFHRWAGITPREYRQERAEA